MGSGDWFKTIISRKKAKKSSLKQAKESSANSAKSNSFKLDSESGKESASLVNGATGDSLGMLTEDRAALRIQTAFRAYR
ncbi:hypothetical protein CRG98_017793, partial [Punica granatum]